jgi:hypothetical protein
MLTVARLALRDTGVCAAALLVVAALLGPAMTSAAPGVWKCVGAARVPVYQDRPCAADSEAHDVAIDPPPLAVAPLAAPSPSPPPRASPRREPAMPKSRKVQAPARVDATERRFVREGMSEGEVLAKLGPPDLSSSKGGRKSRWTFLPAPGDPQTMTLVRFEEGRVVAVERVTVR